MDNVTELSELFKKEIINDNIELLQLFLDDQNEVLFNTINKLFIISIKTGKIKVTEWIINNLE